MRLLLQLVLAAAFLLYTGLGAPARPQGEVYQQPDGTPVVLFLKGNSEYSWMTDYDDYTVIKDYKNRYVYAKKMNGELVSTGVVAGEGSPMKLGLVPNLKTDPDKRPVNGLVESDEDKRERRELRKSPPMDLCASEASASNPCVIKHLVVLVKFRDHASRKLPDPVQYKRLFNHKGRVDNDETLQFGSVADLFDVNSNGTLKIETTVSPWIQSRHSEAYAVASNFGKNLAQTRAVWREALEDLENKHGFDFSTMDRNNDEYVDSMAFIHSGVAAELPGLDCANGKDYEDRIWSHAVGHQQLFMSKSGISTSRYYVASGVWSRCPEGGKGNRWSIARLGVNAHELCHNLQLPDLGNAGYYELLADMWGRSFDQKPPMMGAWSRYHKGWIEPIRITQSGTYDILPSCKPGAAVYLIDHRMPSGEYFLIENRHWSCYYDEELKDYTANPTNGRERNGAAVWHVDTSDALGWDANGREVVGYNTAGYPGHNGFPRRHFEVALVQGDGEWDIERRENQGDKRDLFKRVSGSHGNASYKIGPSGVVQNDGDRKPSPNTRSYALGRFQDTGITIEFGPGDYKMKMTVTLEGSANGGSSPTPQPIPSPTPRPTQAPVPKPTKAPVPKPTKAPPTPKPSLAPTPSPTPRPTQAPVPKPTKAPVPATSPPTPQEPMKITRLALVDAETGKYIPGGFDCVPNACTGNAKRMDIRAETSGPVQSVRLTLSGPVQESRVENVPEWSLFGYTAGQYNGKALPPGSYTVTAQAFSETQARGTAGPRRIVNFSIRDSRPPTKAPVAPPTKAPVSPTRAPVPPTRAPSPPTQAPVPPTRAPSPPTKAPVPPTRAPTPPTKAPTPAQASETMGVTKFVMVDAETGKDIPGGLLCSPYACTGNTKMIDIRAETSGPVQSVQLTLSGPVEETRVENIPPWALFGNTAGMYNGKRLQPGSYTLTAQPFSETQGVGMPGLKKTHNFIILPPSTPAPPPTPVPPTPVPASSAVIISKLVLMDAATNNEIPNGFGCGSFLCSQQDKQVDFRAEVSSSVKSVKFTLKGPIEETNIENTAPFALFGNTAGNYNGRQLPPGSYSLTAQPFSGKNAQGRSDRSFSVSFNVSDLKVTRFALVDADTNKDIPGGLYCQPTACTGGATKFNIRADTKGNVQSVELTLRKDGVIVTNRIENDAPHSHYGDVLGNYNQHALKPGQYTIEATAYQLPDAQGVASAVNTLDFVIPSVRRKL